MTVDFQETTARPASHNPKGIPAKTPGFSTLAKRISSWTSKGLVSALVLVAGLAFGNQVLQWWGDDPALSDSSAQPVAVADGLGQPAREHRLRFGDIPWSMTRRPVNGTRQDALAMLRAICAESIRSTDALPLEGPGTAEKELIGALGGLEPVQAERGKWALYEMDEPSLMVVGIRRGLASGSARGQAPTDGSRVVTWGTAIPAGADQWVLYALQATPLSGDTQGPSTESFVPPGSVRTLSMQVSGGGVMVSFRGPEDIRAWKDYTDTWLRQHGWIPVGDWQQYGMGWHLRSQRDQAGAEATMDVHFGPDGRGGQTGLVIVTPQAGLSQRK